jgi:VIT1/CCC1 family predicted Fe2+/Mn2+ transporter
MNMPEALKQQKNEINDFTIYTLLSKKEKNEKNRKIFVKIANEEKTHYEFWKQITKQDLKPSALIVYWYTFLVSIFGTSFSLKLLESREDDAIELYHRLSFEYPQAKVIYHEEKHHEIALIDMLEDKKLVYAGAIVLGMNDALVELTGTLSGIALAFDKALVVGVTGMIMGIAASLSMAGSAYLEAKENEDTAISSSVYALYTGGSYILTTLLLVLPFFIFSSMYTGLFMMFVAAFLTIISFNFYVSVAKNQSFLKRSSQMLAITFGVALISFMIGYVVKHYFGIEI